jgi:PAS domain-containing protein
MAPDAEETAVRQLLTENQRLKKLVIELEEKLRKLAPQAEGHTGSSVLKLIEHKDFQLEQVAARLEEKKEQLAEAMAALRLYQEMFENDSTAMIGVNRDGRVILFNRSAPQLLGEKIKESLHKPIDLVDFRAVDPDTANRVRQSLASRKPVDSSVVVRDRRILTTVTPVGTAAENRGALVRIQVVSAK